MIDDPFPTVLDRALADIEERHQRAAARDERKRRTKRVAGLVIGGTVAAAAIYLTPTVAHSAPLTTAQRIDRLERSVAGLVGQNAAQARSIRSLHAQLAAERTRRAVDDDANQADTEYVSNVLFKCLGDLLPAEPGPNKTILHSSTFPATWYLSIVDPGCVNVDSSTHATLNR